MKKKINILIICQYYYPEPFLINEIAPELAKRGYNVTVLTGLPNYPEGIVPVEYKNGKKREEIINGVRIIRCNEIGRKGSKYKLVLNYISYLISASKAIKKLSPDYDIIFCYQLSPITMLSPAVKYKKLNHKPVLNYCLDIWPESAKAHIPGKGIVSKIIFYMIKKYSKKLYSQCDKIAVTSQPFIEYFNQVTNISKDRLVYIPQHSDGSMLNMKLDNVDNGVVDFMFAGNLGKGQKLETLFEAVEKLKKYCLKEKNIYFSKFIVHIVGDGSQKEELEILAKKLNIEDKIIFHGRKNKNEMSNLYKIADVLLITLRGDNFVGNTMPGKLQTYMTVGKPILGAINGAAMEVITEAECGSCVPAEDSNGLCEIMFDYMKNPEKYKKCGENAQKYFKENFTMNVFLDKLEKEIMELILK